MIPGAGIPGVHAFGELPENNGLALGVTLDVAAALIAGMATVETGTIRFVGGSAFTSRPRTALGATIVVGTSIIPGVVRIGHEVTVEQSDGTSRVITLFGFTDEQLRSNDLALALALDDWDWWDARQGKAA